MSSKDKEDREKKRDKERERRRMKTAAFNLLKELNLKELEEIIK